MGQEDQELKIHIVSDADTSGFKQTSAASADLSKEMGVINVSNADVEAATKKTSEAVKEGSEKFGEARREIREVGNELGRAAGLGRLGGLALGGVAASAFAAGKAVEYLKETWDSIKETISGPIEIGIPANAPAHISAAATAWEQYAEARAKVIASSTGAEGTASAQEKNLANELKLIKEVLAAEKEKALADLELNKDQMSPEAYQAARANVANIFDEAGTSAEQKNRRALIANKSDEAFNLEIEAKEKTQRALAIKSAPESVAKNNQNTLDENAINGEKAKKEIQERLALIDRQQKAAAGQEVAEYSGAFGKIAKWAESNQSWQRYGPISYADMRGIESPRLTQAQVAIDTAENYRSREADAAAEKKRLMEEAGTASGKASVLRGEVTTDSKFEAQQNAVDAHVAALHQSNVTKVAGASTETAAAVERFTGAVVGGFNDVRGKLSSHQIQIDQLRQQIATGQSIGHR